MIRFIQLFILFWVLSGVYAQDCPVFFREANQAYQKGDYDLAKRSYLNCIEQGVGTASVYYNLGNTYFRMDSIGKAILYYESALRLDPGNSDIRYNLDHAESRKMDQLDSELEENPVLHGIFLIHHGWSLKTQLLVLLFLSWLAAFLLFVLLRVRHPKRRLWAMVGLAVVVALGAPGVLSAGYKIWVLETVQKGVVTVRATDVYSGPGKQYQVLNELHEGTSFEVLSVKGEWVSIKVDNRIGGFVQKNEIGLVNP